MSTGVRAHPPLRLSFEVCGPYALVDSLRLQRFGRPDPTVTFEVAGTQERFAKCARTPEGLVTMTAWTASTPVNVAEGEARTIDVALYGPGAQWLAPRMRRVLGLEDEVTFVPTHPRLRPYRATFAANRLAQAMVMSELHSIIILQQRITFAEAARAWRDVCVGVREAAPGPLALAAPPGPEHWLALRQPEARALNIDARRWSALQHAAAAAADVNALAHDADALAQLAETLSGTGPWTSGLLRGLGAGDADAIILGDVHLPHEVAAFLTGSPVGDDAQMVELLEPFRPHRFRVVRVMMGLGRRKR